MLHLKYLLSCGMILLTLGTAWAQGLMNYESRAALDRTQEHYLQAAMQEASSGRTEVSTINFDVMRGSGFSLNLPDGQSFEIIKMEEEQLDSKRYFYLGEVSGAQGQVHLIRKGDMLTGHLQLADKIYSIRPLSGDKHAVIEVDQSQYEACNNGERQLRPSDQLKPEDIQRSLPLEWQNEGEVSPARSAGDCRIRVLVAYTTAVGAVLADPLSKINLAIQLTNTGYANSGIGHRLELARAFETSYTESSSQQTNLNRFTNNGDGYMDEVHTERARWRADMCHLLTNNGSGIAWVSNGFSNVFAVTNQSYVNGYTFGHEIGHNHRANHDPSDYGGSSNYRGYGNPSGYFRTVMAYGSACGAGSCSRVNEFSGPSNYYYYAPTSSWYVTGNNSQNNVAAHNNSGSTIANHYNSYVNAYYTSTTVKNDEAIHAAASLTIQNNALSPNFIYNYGSEGSFKASQRVTLVPGFRAKAGSSFRAYLENCTPLRTAGNEQQEETASVPNNSSSEDPFSLNASANSLSSYPNPFNEQATIDYSLAKSGTVKLYVRNTLGQIVLNLVNGNESAGSYRKSLQANRLAQGVYYLVLETESERLVEKIVVAK